MNEEFDFEDNLDIFNANFECNDKDQILDLYRLEKYIENNDIISKKIKREKYNHPLFLNYNYCLFCLERRKTKYNHLNLNENHRKADINAIGEFLENQQISIKIPLNKIEKISKRRFIHSCEHIQSKNVVDYVQIESDTDLYIQKENENDENCYNINTLKKIKLNSEKKKFKRKNLKKSSKQISPHFKIDKIDEQIKQTDLNKEDKENNNSIKKLKKRNLTKSYNWKFKPLSKKDPILYSKTVYNKENNKEGENIIFNSSNKEINSRQDKEKKPFSIFGFFANYFYDNKENDINQNNSFMEELDETENKDLKYFEKNERCEICLGEINDKFTLFCGDFFCRQCIINLLEESIVNISLFNKIECPRCHEPINENIIKFLLQKKYFNKYLKIKTRIEGLKNGRNIPCPHPDCEGFAFKEDEINGTFECQNKHIFCGKCLEEISSHFRLEPNKTHVCVKKFEETEKFLEKDKNIRKCPKCKCWVQREPKGCNYFRCTNIWCEYEFCWICGGKYDSSHYRNPFSICFGLSGSNFSRNIKMRRIRCILISLLFILILLPIIIIFFSFFLIGSFVTYFQFDGKEMRNIRFHSKYSNKTFYILYILFIIFISIGLIPFGYICLVLLLLSIPILLIISKIRKKNSTDF